MTLLNNMPNSCNSEINLSDSKASNKIRVTFDSVDVIELDSLEAELVETEEVN